jgi:tRNA (cmo5U34)-methyltransferase
MQALEQDHTLPEGKWLFDADVARVFDNMLVRSIPQYEVMRQACFEIACRYVQPKTAVVDLGCSRGEALAPLVDRFGAANRFLGVEVSPPMLAAARQRFRSYIDCGLVEIRDTDLRREYPPVQASVTLSILTLQFTPIEYRQRILREVWKHMLPGGAFVLVEKILGATAELDGIMVETYYRLKSANGYTQEEIERKRLSLEGVLVPVTARWNEELLHMTGFRQVDCFWRWMNFAGWVAVKE